MMVPGIVTAWLWLGMLGFIVARNPTAWLCSGMLLHDTRALFYVLSLLLLVGYIVFSVLQ